MEVTTPPTTISGSPTISPDGEKIVFTTNNAGKSLIWLHSLESGVTRALPGTEDALYSRHCWSPDSKSIAYSSANALKRLDLETGKIQILVSAPNMRACSWNREGTILFSLLDGRAIYRTTDQPGSQPTGATPLTTVVTTLPYFLPDGRHFLYWANGEGIYVGELGGAPPKHLLVADGGAIFSSNGYVLFPRQQTLYAQKFDPETLTLSGSPIEVARPIPLEIDAPPVSASSNGHLIYRTGVEGGTERQLAWFDRTGKITGTIADRISLGSSPLFLSNDGSLMALSRPVDGVTNIWIAETSSGKLTRLTDPPGLQLWPVLSPDKRTVYYGSNQTGVFEMYERPSAGGEEKLVMSRVTSRLPRDISRDGRFMLYRAGPNRIWAIQLDGNPRGEFAVVEVTPPAQVEGAQFSPDGRWLVYNSTESGRFEVYAQQFPSGRRFQVSTDGGFWPRWQGNEIFYISADNQLMAVPIEVSSDPQETKPGKPIALFTPPIRITVSNNASGAPYAVTGDGQRFVVGAVSPVKSPITVIKNWQPQVKP
jgi:Tol biopolymer transport system component